MIEEVQALSSPQGLVRVPPELDIPVTKRVMRLVDSGPMRRLSRISQLGLVAQVYPGAVHSRLEHSLGVYRGALVVLQHLATNPRFQHLVGPHETTSFVLAALLHDIGHWPFCHPIEDMGIADVPSHESRARALITGHELQPLIATDWHGDTDQVLRILEKRPQNDSERLLATLLSGPIDIDKMDYLVRDSLHAGVPYGRNFDSARLISAFGVHPHKPSMLIGDKGRTAAEMMVFARYVMFSEVYWHHAVRSATAMLQRAVYLLRDRIDLAAMYDCDEATWIRRLRRAALGKDAEPLVEGLFGDRRVLLKRVAQFNVLDQPDEHQRLAHRPYGQLAAASERLAEALSRITGISLGSADVIIDAPPVKLEVDIQMDVMDSKGNCRPLGQVSPVVDALANRQFDSHVKRVRVFVRPDIRDKLPGRTIDPEMLMESIQ